MIIEMKDNEEYVCQCKYIMCFFKAEGAKLIIVLADKSTQTLHYETATDRNSDHTRLKEAMFEMYRQS